MNVLLPLNQMKIDKFSCKLKEPLVSVMNVLMPLNQL